MKSINELIKESNQVKYRVALIGCTDKEDLPISVSILVDADNAKAFEKFLEDEQDNLFAHADGGNIEY